MLTFCIFYDNLHSMKRYLNFSVQDIPDDILKNTMFILDTESYYIGSYTRVNRYYYEDNSICVSYNFEHLFNYNSVILDRYGEYF